MAKNVTIYGQDLCAFTSAARADFSRRKVPFVYVNVLEDDAGLEQMMKLTNGRRKIPVIVEDGKLTVGFGGT